MLQHTLQSGHPSVSLNEFKILGKGFKDNKVKRKIWDDMYNISRSEYIFGK